MSSLLWRNYEKVRMWGKSAWNERLEWAPRMSTWDEPRRFQLVFVAQPFTHSLPTRIQ